MNEEPKLKEVTALLGREKLNKNEQWMFDNFQDKPGYIFLKDTRGKLQVHKITTAFQDDSNQELWGEDLFKVFGSYIDEKGWLTSEWADILEREVPRWDDNYIDNPEYGGTYSRMYNTDFENNADETMIRPIAN